VMDLMIPGWSIDWVDGILRQAEIETNE
jgi:hypothetical protein